ncbi:MAG: UDP-N-acetylglucosamine 1-carboxyvinyltransferase [Clostridia bacterium]|nr:UDP-N-acetylglucosamine 1-carboxyvinyltransferase [Clostridia bacterium]
MSKLYIIGGNKLNGEITIPSAKNTLLPILASCILVDGEVKINNFTNYRDCIIMTNILSSLGAKIKYEGSAVIIDCRNINEWTITTELAKELRSSFFTLGAVLGRIGLAKVAYPGGCNIGARPVNIHLKALRDLGVSIIERHGYIYCNADGIKANTIHLDFPSVGATENIMMASCVINGTTIISNCAKEPEIEDLQNFLNSCGANISGAGTDTITIVGVGHLLHSTEYTCISDRIIAGTYAIATACTGGSVKLKDANSQHLIALTNVLKNAGVNIVENKKSLHISADKRLVSVPHISTMPYPCFPTDLQSQILVMQAISNGNSVISENIFESRFKVVPELKKMGAVILVKNNVAYISGVECLYGAEVYATDLRAGASLVIAGLVANGYTTVNNVEYIDRGYLKIEEDLSKLGADIKRID